MTRDDFFKDVLTKDEYATISNAFDAFEERTKDIVVEVREKIEGVMDTLYKKNSSTEFVGNYFTLINRIGEMCVIEHSNIEDGEEISLDDIEDVNELIDILSEFI
jgi:methyl-accepting chemotaxis protein